MPLDLFILGATSVAAAGGAAACAQRARCSSEGDGFKALADGGASKKPTRFQVAKAFLAAKLSSEEPAKKTPEPWVQRPKSPTSGTPWEYQCPIGLEPLVDPVRAADGIVYERQAINEWMAKSRTSPVTGARLSTTKLNPERALKREIDAWRAAARPDAEAPTLRIDVCLHDYGEICGVSMLRRQAADASPPSVCHIIPGSSAARAGLKEGDWLVSVDSAPLPENAQGPELVSIVAGAGRPVYLSFARPAGGNGGLLGGPAIDGPKIRSGEHIVL